MRKIFLFLLMLAGFCHAEEESQSLAEHVHYHLDAENLIGYLDIGRDQAINQSTYIYVRFALEEYVKRGAIFVILHLNTPGGEVFPAMKIAELLQNLDTVHHIPVVAVVDNWALSAGAMLAYSCRYIAVSKSALMGAAEPITSSGDGKMESAPEKIVSALRAEFASLAKFYGRNPLIAQAMVDKDIILVKRHGEIVQMHDDAEFKADTDERITVKGKLLTLDAEQLIDLKVVDFTLPIAAIGENPLFAYPFFSEIPNKTLLSYSDWKIGFFAFLTHPLIASLLMMGLMIGVYMEMSHPGFGLPGVVALICLALILLSSFASEVVGWLEILFVVVGILLFLVEIFVLPGFGVTGAIGILLILFGMIAMMLPNFSSVHFSWDWDQWNLHTFAFFDRLALYCGALILAFIIIALMARFITPRLMKKSPMVLHDDQEGNIAGPEINSLPQVGSTGVAFSSLCPGGRVMIGDKLYDAQSEVSFIEKGEKVIVVKIRGSVIIIAKDFN